MAYQESAVTRQQLVDATVRVVSAHGVAKATTRKIAQEAKLNLATVHYVFGSKEELFAAVMLDCMAPQVGAMGGVAELPAKCGLRLAVVEVIKGFRKSVTEHSALAIAQYELLCWALRSKDADHLAKRITEEYITAIRAQFDGLANADDTGVDLAVLARYVYMIIDGMYFQHLTIGAGVGDDELGPLADALLGVARSGR